MVVRHDRGRGASAARNSGLDAARGELRRLLRRRRRSGSRGRRPGWWPRPPRRPASSTGQHQVLIEPTGRTGDLPAADLPDARPPAVARRVAHHLRGGPPGDRGRRPPLRHRPARPRRTGTCASGAPRSLPWSTCPRPSTATSSTRRTGSRPPPRPTPWDTGRSWTSTGRRCRPACVAHHELAYALAVGDRRAVAHQAAQVLRHPGVLGSAALLAGEMAASGIGRRRHDPGLSPALRRPAAATGHRWVPGRRLSGPDRSATGRGPASTQRVPE